MMYAIAMLIRKILIVIFLMLFAITILLLTIVNAPRLFGYRVNEFSGNVAKVAAERNDVSICRSILNIGLFIPTTHDSRIHCVHEYASITKDPAVCAGLMPSTYGLSCLGVGSIPTPCAFYDEQKVVWNDGAYQEIQFETCDIEQRPLGKACCAAARGRFDPSFAGNCDDILTDDPLIKDQCDYEIALKFLEVERCQLIESPNLFAACSLHVSTLSRHPELQTR